MGAFSIGPSDRLEPECFAQGLTVKVGILASDIENLREAAKAAEKRIGIRHQRPKKLSY